MIPDQSVSSMAISDSDLERLRQAKNLLENPGIAARATGALGRPVEALIDSLPQGAQETLHHAVEVSLQKALSVAVSSLDASVKEVPDNWLHKIGVAVTGGIGGFFGLAALAVELPISTTLMLRSIADIARSEGESIGSPESQLACISVFAMGGQGAETAEAMATSSYYATRQILAQSLNTAAQYIAENGIAEASAPAIVRLIAAVGSRFGVQVSEKLAVQAIPLIGAAGGAIINTLFMDHFQDMAKGHFTVRSLERKYGEAAVQQAYQAL